MSVLVPTRAAFWLEVGRNFLTLGRLDGSVCGRCAFGAQCSSLLFFPVGFVPRSLVVTCAQLSREVSICCTWLLAMVSIRRTP